MVSQLTNVLLGFLVRTVFIECLSDEYLGINGLFTNILTMLSLAEMGVGSAIIYNLYKPIAEKDEIQIAKLMNLYRDAYRVIGCVIAVIGLCIIPFFDFIIKDQPDVENLIFIYILFLSNTVASYFCAFRRSIFTADQNERVLHIFKFIFYIIRSIGQVTVLIVLKNFIVYLIIQILCTVFENVLVYLYSDQKYRFLKKYKSEKLTKLECKPIFDNIKALFIYKIGSTILDGSANIILSAFVGVVWVGKLSNYSLVTSSVMMILSYISSAVTASVGNFVAKESSDRHEGILNVITFVNYIFYGLSTVCMIVLINPFVEIWIGAAYRLEYVIGFVLCINTYIYGMMNSIWTFRATMGLFIYGKWRPAISAVINIIVSIWWAKELGLIGVLLGTTFTRVVTNVWYDPLVVYRHGLKKSPVSYYLKWIGYLLTILLDIVIIEIVFSVIVINGVLGLLLKAGVSLFIFFMTVLIMYGRTNEFQYLIKVFQTNILKLKINQ